MERKHRHIIKVGLSPLAHAHMPLKFCDEAFIATTFLINHTPSKIISYDTPLASLQDSTKLHPLRIFACAC
jgi:hypothetical protein